MKSNLEEALFWQIKAARLLIPEREYRFHDERKWRFDFAWPSIKLALEIHGGIYIQGAHTRGRGFENDCEKTCSAILLGWDVMPVTAQMVKNGRALWFLERML